MSEEKSDATSNAISKSSSNETKVTHDGEVTANAVDDLEEIDYEFCPNEEPPSSDEIEDDDEDFEGELDELNAESELPIEELLARYQGEGFIAVNCNEGEVKATDDLEKTEEVSSTLVEPEEAEDDSQDGEDESSNELALSILNSASQLEDDEFDHEYDPAEDAKKAERSWKRYIRVGENFQADIMDDIVVAGCDDDYRKFDFLPYEFEDSLVWQPRLLDESTVQEFLISMHQMSSKRKISETNVPDNDGFLYNLMCCGGFVEEAIRRAKKLNIYTTPISTATNRCGWSEEECRLFENGLRLYGKDFFTIHQKEVLRTRCVMEMVEFYYYWKKTERHDEFVKKYRTSIQRNKKSQHQSIDLMEQYIEEFVEDPDEFGKRQRLSDTMNRSPVKAEPQVVAIAVVEEETISTSSSSAALTV